MLNNGIRFIDRTLKPHEKYHYQCKSCGKFLHPDFVHSHKCIKNVR